MGQNIEIVYVHEGKDYTHDALPEKVRQEFAKNAEKAKFADFTKLFIPTQPIAIHNSELRNPEYQSN